MKLALLSSLFITSASAFAPVAPSFSCATARYMSEEAAAEPAEEVAAVVEEPAPTGPQKVPCFGASPFLGGDVFLGETYWDKITMEWGTADTGTFVRAAELKHGRSAMLATVGFLVHKLGFTLNNISPHEYLSVTQDIKFADLQAMTPLEAVLKVPGEGYAQVFAFIAIFELYELTHKGGKIAEGERVAPGLQAGGLTGDLGWNPLNVEITDRRRLAELQNGRAAMVAISAWLAHDAIAGSVPLPLPW